MSELLSTYLMQKIDAEIRLIARKFIFLSAIFPHKTRLFLSQPRLLEVTFVMRSRLLPTKISFPALFLLLVSLTGCSTTSTAPIVTTPITSEVGSNWQFNGGASITAAGAILTGAMQIQGTQVTGSFQTNVPCADVPQPVTFAGTYNPTTGALNIKPTGLAFVDVNVIVPADPTQMASGTIGGAGTVCSIAFQGPGVGIEIPALTGIYTGTVAAASPSSSTGTATLTVSQSSTPNASAQFPLTGTLQFTSGACSSSIPVNGTISGAGFTLTSSASTPNIIITGADTQNGTTLPATAITFSNGPCNTGSSPATYSGDLVRQ